MDTATVTLTPSQQVVFDWLCTTSEPDLVPRADNLSAIVSTGLNATVEHAKGHGIAAPPAVEAALHGMLADLHLAMQRAHEAALAQEA